MIPAHDLAPIDLEDVHDKLAINAHRYINRSSLSKFLYVEGYDPKSPASDYSTTYWPVKPNRASERVASIVIPRMFKMPASTLEQDFYASIDDQADDVLEALKKHAVMVVTDHDKDLQPIIPVVGLAKARARREPGRYKPNLQDAFKANHAILSRAHLLIRVGKERLPLFPRYLSLLRAGRLVATLHGTLPNIDSTKDIDIPGEFMHLYNEHAIADLIKAAHTPSLGSTYTNRLFFQAPTGTGTINRGKKAWERLPQDVRAELPEDSKIIAPVKDGTIRLVRAMGCAVVPAYTSFQRDTGRSNVIKFGEVVMPEQFTEQTLHEMMSTQAQFRNQHGETNVFYWNDLAA